MADHERGEVVAWLCTPTTIGFGAHEVVGSPEERDHYAWYRHTIEPLVRQSDYLEAVADLNTVRALVEQQNAALTEAADEIERLRAENAAIRTVADEAELNREGIKAAHADLRKLRARIEASPVGELVQSHACPGDFALDAGQGVPVDISALAGKRVRLVVDEGEG